MTSPLETVRAKLTEHAERGLFRSLTETQARNGQTIFRFVWLVDTPFELVVDPNTPSLQFRNLLPALPANSGDYRAVKTFIQDRSHPDLRPHRRIDPDRVTLSCNSRSGNVSVTLTIKDGDASYALEKLLNLVNELFGELHLHRPEYMIAEFGASEE